MENAIKNVVIINVFIIVILKFWRKNPSQILFSRVVLKKNSVNNLVMEDVCSRIS